MIDALKSHSSAVTLLAAFVSMTMLTGCGDNGPTAEQAVQRLKRDVNLLLDEINATNIKVTDDGSRNVLCRDGKVKRMYTVRATRATSGDKDGLVTLVIGAKRDDYKLVQPKTPTTPAVIRNRRAHTHMTIDSPGNDILTISSSTDCLRPK